MRNSLIYAVCVASILGFSGMSAEPNDWPHELSIRQFKIHCDFELRDSRELTSQLDSLTRSVEELLRITSERKPVHIVLFETSAAYERYMHNYFPKLPARRAIFIQDRGPGMLFTHWHDDVQTDLRHEVTHALLNEQSAPLPLWLDEGLAEYFEVAEEQRFDANPYLDEVAELARAGVVPSLLQLEAIDQLENFENTQYRDSWAWIHFLLHRTHETRMLLVDYLQRCRAGDQQLEFSRQLVKVLPKLNAEFQQHFTSLVDKNSK